MKLEVHLDDIENYITADEDSFDVESGMTRWTVSFFGVEVDTIIGNYEDGAQAVRMSGCRVKAERLIKRLWDEA